MIFTASLMAYLNQTMQNEREMLLNTAEGKHVLYSSFRNNACNNMRVLLLIICGKGLMVLWSSLGKSL